MRAAPETFRAYDIRGIVPDQLDAGGAEQIARAFAAHVKPKTAVVGRDVRLTGPQFKEAVIRGLTNSGVDVVDIDQVSTDEFYFACGSRKLPGILITASHNPPEYNGFKMVEDFPFLVLAKEFRPLVLNESYEDSPRKGSVKQVAIQDSFVEHMLQMVDVASIKPLKVVIDTSNGAQGPVWQRLEKSLPIDIVPLFFEPDGRFPNHGNDVIQVKNQEKLIEAVKWEKADLGLIFDPDGDRCLAVDDRGVSVPGDFLTALMAVAKLDRYPGGTIVYDIRASNAVPDLVTAAGGTPFVWKPGHVYIKRKMKELDAVYGGEVSGHYYFKDFWYADCGVLAGLSILEYVSKLGAPLSSKVAELEKKYFLSGEINSSIPDGQAVLERVREKYADGEVNELSGIAVSYPDWHFCVRPSDNEPLVRLTVEANSRELMEAKRDELLALIRQNTAEESPETG